jgi:hypothetical protein
VGTSFGKRAGGQQSRAKSHPVTGALRKNGGKVDDVTHRLASIIVVCWLAVAGCGEPPRYTAQQIADKLDCHLGKPRPTPGVAAEYYCAKWTIDLYASGEQQSLVASLEDGSGQPYLSGNLWTVTGRNLADAKSAQKLLGGDVHNGG